MATPTLESIPKVDIDPSGVFKYILIKVYDTVKDSNREEPFITIVRGYQRCNYHSDIYDEVFTFSYIYVDTFTLNML